MLPYIIITFVIVGFVAATQGICKMIPVKDESRNEQEHEH